MFGPSRRELYRELCRERQAWAAERQLLVDRVLYLTGTMIPPPHPVPSEPFDDEREEREEQPDLVWDLSHAEDEPVEVGAM